MCIIFLLSFYEKLNQKEKLISLLKNMFFYYKNSENQFLLNKTKILFIQYVARDDISIAIDFLEENHEEDENLLNLYKISNQPEKAYELLNRLYVKTDNLDYLAQQAIFEFEMTNDKESVLTDVISKFEKVLETTSNHIYENYLAYILIDFDIDVKKGLILVKKALEVEFKDPNSKFKIAIVVDMWLTGFDVPFLDTIYIDKPIQEHNLIQTISRVNRKYAGKEKGLVVDYIGIKTAMNKALKQFSKMDSQNFEDIEASIVVVRDQLDLLSKLFYKFDTTKYFIGTPTEQLATLNNASEFVQLTKELENIFLERLKSEDITPTAPYNIYDDLDIDRKLGDDILKSLTAKKDVIRLQHNLFIHSQSLNKIIKSMREIIKQDGFIEIFNFKQRFDLSRKYLVCYLDYLDNFSDIKKVENRRVLS